MKRSRAERMPYSPAGAAMTSWRLTTATRVFALALITGRLLSGDSAGALAVVLLSLVLVAAAAAVLELSDRSGRVLPLVTIGEGIIVAVLVAQPVGAVQPLLVYLAVPTLVAGLRLGVITTINTFLATALGLIAAWTVLEPIAHSAWLESAATWLMVGLGTGLLAARFSRSIRRLEEGQAPYAAAHRLLTQLHTLTGRHRLGLDSRANASDLLQELQARTNSCTGALVVDRPGGEFRIGMLTDGERVLIDCLDSATPTYEAGTAAWPLRVGDQQFGAVALNRPEQQWTKNERIRTQEMVDEAALRLETALVFEQVRDVATTEERGRVAREIHDGIAQEVAGLGYRLDDLAAAADDPTTKALARELRAEVSRVVGELRLSILDLRIDGVGTDFVMALSDYAREMGARSGLRVHLVLDATEGTGPQPTDTPELLRIVQEAISNVRRHAHAINVWLNYTSDKTGFTLQVADDGIGSARARHGHYGLATMRERAQHLGYRFQIADRSGGGTSIRVTSRPAVDVPHPPASLIQLASPSALEESHVHDRSAHR